MNRWKKEMGLALAGRPQPHRTRKGYAVSVRRQAANGYAGAPPASSSPAEAGKIPPLRRGATTFQSLPR